MKDIKINKIPFPILCLVIILIISNVITIILYINEKYSIDEETFLIECEEELTNFRYFVTDWYDEMSVFYGEIEVYRNEIRFKNGLYPLTISDGRVRAQYPRGERFFRLNHISYSEFYYSNDRLLCRVFYGNGGEFVFKIF